MEKIHLDYSHLLKDVSEEEIFAKQGEVDTCHSLLHKKSGAGNDYLGWLDLPSCMNGREIQEIESAAQSLREKVDVFIVIGIGGSYLGAKGVIDALSPAFSNSLPKSKTGVPHIIFAGHHLDSTYHYDLMDYLKGKSFAINVISKSGTTTEPALAFRMFKTLLEENVGKEKAKRLIFATTDRSKGALRNLSDLEGYQSFVIPGDVGGRFSVLTPVGLFPMAVAGIDLGQMIQGAVEGQKLYEERDLKKNPAYFYAAARNLLYQKGKKIEVLVNYIPALQYMGEWWKQLYGESEGKDKRGIFPATCNFTTDLHSMGQWIQDGERTIFETIIHIEKSRHTIQIEKDSTNLDKLNFLAGKDIGDVNRQAMKGTALAHLEGGVPSMTLKVPELNAYYLGQLIYFFEKACGMSAYLLGVNPFDQPGVEAYKKNMFALIGKPGFEEERKTLLKSLSTMGDDKII